MSDQPPTRNKVQAKLFAGERRDHFNRKVRMAALDQARSARDAETRRMEQYRRLCEKEGIQSKRLADYDEKKAEANQSVDAALRAVDDDYQLSTAERKKRKFQIKRKAASRASLTEHVSTTHTLDKMEKVRAARQAEKDEKEREIQERVTAKRQALAVRKDRNARFSQRTRAGQPVMATRMADLLERVQRSK